MPILPTVDYSPISDAIAGKGRAEQAGYQTQLASLSDRFRTLQKSEEKRQEVFGAIDGALKVGSQIYGIMEQSKMEVGKQALIQQSAANQKYIEEARLNRKIFIGQGADGSSTIEVSDEVQQYFDNQLKELDDSPEFRGFGRVKEQLKTTLVQTQTGSLEQARTALFQKAQAEGIAAGKANKGAGLNSAIESGNYESYLSIVKADGTTTPKGKELDDIEGWQTYTIGRGSKAVRAAASESYEAALKVAEEYAGEVGPDGRAPAVIDEKGRSYLKAVALQADKEAEAAALESSANKYESTKKAAEESGSPFMSDATIKDIAKQYPEARRATVESQLRKAQSYENIRSGTEQFNADRDNPNLSYLEKQYNTIQTDPRYEGDELTRSTVMSWYEGLIGNMRSRNEAGSAKADNDESQAILEGNFTMFESGNIPGPQAIRTIEELMNSGSITGPQAAAAKKRITSHEFPQAKQYLDGSQGFASKVLGIKKKFSDMNLDEQRKVNALSTSYESYISDKLFEGGANADLDKITRDAETAVTSKAFDQVRQGFSLFKSREAITETAMAKTIAAFDTSAGAALTFQDRFGKTKYLSEDPTQTQATIETVAQYGTEQLEKRGIAVAKWKLESEGDYDVTSMPIFIGADGLQYRMKGTGDTVEYFSRGSENAEWKKLPEAPSPVSAPVVLPPSARPGATTPPLATKVVPVTDEAYAAAQAAEEARKAAIRKSAEEAAAREAARKGRR